MDKSCKGCGCTGRRKEKWIHLRAVAVDLDTETQLAPSYTGYFCVKCITKIDEFIESLEEDTQTVKCESCGGDDFFQTNKFFREIQGGLMEGPTMYSCHNCSRSYTLSEFVAI